MSDIRYLLDENVDPILRTKLLRRDSDLTIEMTWGETANTQLRVKETCSITKSLFRPHVH